MNDYLESLKDSKIIRFSQRIVLPGFDGVPFYNVMVFFVKGLMKGALNTRATSLSFQFFLSLFPALIFLFTLIPFIPIDNFQEGLMQLIQDILPASAYDLTASTLDDIINRQRTGLLSIVFVVVLYLATNGVDAMLEAFGESIHIERKRNYFHQKGVAFILLTILTFLLILCIGLIFLSAYTVGYLKEINNILGAYILSVSKWIIVLAMYYFAISILFYYGNVKRKNWKFFSAGSTLATIMTLILSWGFGYYVNNLALYNSLYGSIGTLIVILLLIYFNAFVILIGFELNVSIQQAGKKLNLT